MTCKDRVVVVGGTCKERCGVVGRTAGGHMCNCDCNMCTWDGVWGCDSACDVRLKAQLHVCFLDFKVNLSLICYASQSHTSTGVNRG